MSRNVLTLGVVLATLATGGIVSAQTPPGACTVDDSDWTTEDGGCKQLATGLVFAFWSYPLQFDWFEATAYCDNLVQGGFDDWRLPTKGEAEAVAAAGGAGAHLPFDVCSYSRRWTSSKAGNKRWQANFCTGETVKDITATTRITICVRGVEADDGNGNGNGNGGGNGKPMSTPAGASRLSIDSGPGGGLVALFTDAADGVRRKTGSLLDATTSTGVRFLQLSGGAPGEGAVVLPATVAAAAPYLFTMRSYVLGSPAWPDTARAMLTSPPRMRFEPDGATD